MLRAALDNGGANGDFAAIAAPGVNQCIAVSAYVIVAGGTVSVTWKSKTGSGTTALSGAMPMSKDGTNGPRIISPPAIPANPCSGNQYQLVCKPGEALNLFTSSGVSVTGHIEYDLVPPGSN